jgi:ferrous iron transport protein B
MLVLFLMLAFLEECGYMARIAFMMDRVFRRFGLSGKSFIPLLIGMGCGVPGIMASRTIESEQDRRMTVITTTFIPCGAKLPIIALFAGAFFGGSACVAASAYFLGVGAVMLSGIMLKKTRPFAGEPTPFVMELPAYHLPKASAVLRSTWERSWSFIKKAGTIILLASLIIWFLQGYGFTAGQFGPVADMDHSLLATFGRALAGVFIPLGFGNWQAAVATLTGFVAKEQVVATLSVLLHTGDGLGTIFTALSGYAFLVFNLLCMPCVAAVGAIRREMHSPRWTLFAIGYQMAFAYAVALIIYQLGMFVTGHGFTLGTAAGVAALGGFIYMALRPRSPEKAAGKPAAE